MNPGNLGTHKATVRQQQHLRTQNHSANRLPADLLHFLPFLLLPAYEEKGAKLLLSYLVCCGQKDQTREPNALRDFC